MKIKRGTYKYKWTIIGKYLRIDKKEGKYRITIDNQRYFNILLDTLDFNEINEGINPAYSLLRLIKTLRLGFNVVWNDVQDYKEPFVHVFSYDMSIPARRRNEVVWEDRERNERVRLFFKKIKDTPMRALFDHLQEEITIDVKYYVDMYNLKHKGEVNYA